MTLEDHINLQKRVVNRLRDAGYTHIIQNKEYEVKRNGHWLRGEVDILALSPYGAYHFYEIKSCRRKVYKAQEQYDRFKQAFPELEAKGVFVSYGKCKRLH